MSDPKEVLEHIKEQRRQEILCNAAGPVLDKLNAEKIFGVRDPDPRGPAGGDAVMTCPQCGAKLTLRKNSVRCKCGAHIKVIE